MKPMYLEDITYYENIEEGYYFTPINAVFRYFEEWEIKGVTDFVKILFLIKHLELCEKYGFAVDSFILENYLSSKDSIYTVETIYEFLENSGICEDDEMTIQHFFTDEFMNYFDEIDFKINSTNSINITEELYFETKVILKEKYDYELAPINLPKNKGHYEDFVSHLIQSEIIISYEEPEVVLSRISQEESEEKNKVYSKNQSNPYGDNY